MSHIARGYAIGVLITLIVFMVCGAKSVMAQGTCDEYIELPPSFIIMDNGLEDVLYTYISVLWSDPSSLVESWGESDEGDREVYYLKRQEFMDGLIELYLAEGTVLADMGQWYLGFLRWVEEFQEQILIPKILTTGEVLYQLPKLETQGHTYMPIRAITEKTSRQWAFKPYLLSDAEGFVRYGEAYGIALGQYFGIGIGDIYQITFSDGQVILGVLTDCKALQDTDPTRRYADAWYRFDGTRGNIVEFVMDDELPQFLGLPYTVLVNTINEIIREKFPGDVIEIRKVGKADVVF